MMAGLPPLGGMSMPVVLLASHIGRPDLMNLTRPSSDSPRTNPLVVRGSPSCSTPSAPSPWQAAHEEM